MRCYDGLPVTNAGKRIKNLLKLECPPVMTLEARWGVKHIHRVHKSGPRLYTPAFVAGV